MNKEQAKMGKPHATNGINLRVQTTILLHSYASKPDQSRHCEGLPQLVLHEQPCFQALLDRLEAVSFPLDEMNPKEAAESDIGE